MSKPESSSHWFLNYQKKLEEERVDACRTLGEACTALAEQGVVEVRLEYDGYGDSGAIEGVQATGATGEIKIPSQLCERLILAAEQLLPSGWENNTGAFGELVLDVTGRRITREHNWRIEESDYEEEAWDL